MPIQPDGAAGAHGANVTAEPWRSVAALPLRKGRAFQSAPSSAPWKTAGLKKALAPNAGRNANLEAFWKLVKVRAEVRRGQIIATTSASPKHFTVLFSGLACMTTRHLDGARQIFAFHYPGDFVALHSFLSPGSTELIEVEALSNCSVGAIDRDVLEQAIQDCPELGQTLWQAAMNEASVFRQRLVMARSPAQQRVAHLLCEQLCRLGPNTSVIPLNQIEIADTVGLSIVHTNRVLQDLRKLGVLSDKRCIEVLHKTRLQELAAFNSGCSDARETMSRWDVRFED